MVLPLILGALGGTLGAGTAVGALGGAAIGSGLGGFAQTGDLETGILTGLGAFAGGALLGPVMGGGAGAAGATAPAATATATPAVTAAAANPAAAPMGGLGSLLSGPAPGSTASLLGTTTPKPGLVGGAMDFAKSGTGMGVGIGGMMGASLGPMFDDGGKKKPRGAGGKEMRPIPRDVQFPGADYQPGISAEFDYGFGPPPSAGQVLDYRDNNVNPYRMAGGGMIRSLEQTFGPIRLAEGGLATLIEGGAPAGGNEKDVVAEAVRAIKGESANPEIALGAFLSQFGEDALRDLVDKVQSGEMDRTAARSEGMLRGPGDGMDDLIPANIENDQDVLLSDGEFVVPADVVSGLGNGSSDAGARALEAMMEKVRAARNGSTEQPPQVPTEAMLPV